jgi:hypothetical protein
VGTIITIFSGGLFLTTFLINDLIKKDFHIDVGPEKLNSVLLLNLENNSNCESVK